MLYSSAPLSSCKDNFPSFPEGKVERQRDGDLGNVNPKVLTQSCQIGAFL